MFMNFKNLAGLIGIVVLAACSNGETIGFASGLQIGAKNVESTTDIGKYRIQVQEIYAARKYTIPYTLRFSFSWSPAEVKAIHRKHGYKTPTEADWQRHKEFLATPRVHSNKTYAFSDKTIHRLFAMTRDAALNSGYEHVVWPNGAISTCRNASAVNKWCSETPHPSHSLQVKLAQKVLDLTKPGCRVGRVEPKEVDALSKEYQKGLRDRRLRAEVICD